MSKLPVNYDELTPLQRREVRGEYGELQLGKCYHCGKSLSRRPPEDKWIDRKLFPKGFFNYPLHLHHDHITGMTIGVVHSQCNAILWQYHGE